MGHQILGDLFGWLWSELVPSSTESSAYKHDEIEVWTSIEFYISSQGCWCGAAVEKSPHVHEEGGSEPGGHWDCFFFIFLSY